MRWSEDNVINKEDVHLVIKLTAATEIRTCLTKIGTTVLTLWGIGTSFLLMVNKSMIVRMTDIDKYISQRHYRKIAASEKYRRV